MQDDLYWACYHHLLRGKLNVKSVSNLGRWQMLKCTFSHEFHGISSRIVQLHTGKSDIERKVISEDGLPLVVKTLNTVKQNRQILRLSIKLVTCIVPRRKYLKCSCVGSDRCRRGDRLDTQN